jgi:hypothetical protein
MFSRKLTHTQYGISVQNSPSVRKDVHVVREMLLQAGPVLDAVCLLLLPDFACLGYSIPDGCKGEVGRFRAKHLEARRLAKPVVK